MSGTQFTIRRKIFTFLGAKFHDAENNLLGFCKQKAFKLKEDIRIYTDETMEHERVLISARNVIDFSAAYDVVDSANETKLGALKRQGLKSMFRDNWVVMDENDNDIGTLQEDSAGLAMLRRFLMGGLLPQKFHLKDNQGQDIAEFRTHFNPFVHRMTVTVYPDCPLHAMLVLAAGILLVAIEGRESGD